MGTPSKINDIQGEDMPTLLSRDSKIARYLLADLTPNESRRIQESAVHDYHFGREIEAAEEELIAAYVVGALRGQDRCKFETFFFTPDHRRRKLKFAKAWVETGGAACPDLKSPFHQYLLGQMTLDEADEFEETFLNKGHQLDQLGAAEDDLLMAYFHGRLPKYQRELFETNFLPFKSDGMLGKLRFAHIMCEYMKQGRGGRTQWLFKPIGLSLGNRHISWPVWQPLVAWLILAFGILVWSSFF